MSCPIFISYSRKDFDFVTKLVKDIESVCGVECWIDLNGIESGDQFENKIVSAIDNAEVILFMLSDNSMESEYAKMEINYAKNRKKKIIPIIIDHGELRGWFLFKFGGLDYIDIFNDRQKQKLFNDLKRWSDGAASPANSSVQPVQQLQQSASPAPGKGGKSKVILLACVILALIVGVGVYLAVSNNSTAKTENVTQKSKSKPKKKARKKTWRETVDSINAECAKKGLLND